MLGLDILKKLLEPDMLGCMTYISIFLTIYFEFKVKNKKICFQCLNRKDSCIIAFWNACDTTIFREDIQFLSCKADKSSTVPMFFSTDKDIPLEIEYVLNNAQTGNNKRINFAFDYLNKREGIYFVLRGDSVEPIKSFRGRIRGEKKDSVEFVTEYNLFNWIKPASSLILFLWYFLHSATNFGDDTPLSIYMVAVLIDSFIDVKHSIATIMPVVLMKKWRQLKKSGYSDIKTELRW